MAEEEYPPGLCGLLNLGNTCYFSSTIQALLACPPFRNLILNSRQDLKNDTLAGNLAELMTKMWYGDYEYIPPRKAFRAVQTLNRQFAGYGQQDAEELFRWILSKLDEELSFPIGPPPERGSTKVTSAIDRIFGGCLGVRIQCQQCHKISCSKEEFSILSLDIPELDDNEDSKQDVDESPNSRSFEIENDDPQDSIWAYFYNSFSSFSARLGELLQLTIDHTAKTLRAPLRRSRSTTSLRTCFEALCEPEIMDGENKYYCSSCNEKVCAKKETKITKLPNSLCIALKRFKFKRTRYVKLKKAISYPLTGLDLQDFIDEESIDACKDSQYELVSVICHSGSISYGHYVTYCRNETDHHWYEFDDSYVRPVSSEDVLQETKTAYILVFKRLSPSQEKLLQTFEDLVNQSSASDVEKNEKDDKGSIDDAGEWISRQWISLMLNCAEPGPVFNWDFGSIHGFHHPDRPQFDKMALFISKPVADFIYENFGGGPRITHKEPCPISMKQKKQLLKARSLEEKRMNLMFDAAKLSKGSWYAISKSFADALDNYLDCRTLDLLKPPPIDNSNLVDEKGVLKPNLKESVHFLTVPEQVWNYLCEKYGGGPKVVVPSNTMDDLDDDDDSDDENERRTSNSPVRVTLTTDIGKTKTLIERSETLSESDPNHHSCIEADADADTEPVIKLDQNNKTEEFANKP